MSLINNTENSIELNEAIKKDDYLLFKSLLKKNFPINNLDTTGFLPIHLSLYTLNPDKYIKKLCKIDSFDINGLTIDGSTTLLLASRIKPPQKNLSTIKLLIEKKIDVNLSNRSSTFPLLEAIRTQNYEVVKFLCSVSDIEINKCDKYGVTPAHAAVELNDIKILLILLRNKCDITIKDFMNFTPLLNAVFHKNCNAVIELIEHSKKKGIKNYINNSADDQISPLMLACQYDCFKCVDNLIKNGADVKLMTSEFNYVIHFAAEFSCLKILKYILKFFDLKIIPSFTNLRDFLFWKMKNPLHLSVLGNNIEVLDYLIRKNLFNIDSLAFIQELEIMNLRKNKKLVFSTLGFALSINSNNNLIQKLLNLGASIELHSEHIIPPVFCIFNDTILNEKNIFQMFSQLIRNGFNINKFAKLKKKNYLSNFILVIFYEELFIEFLNFGLNTEDLFSLNFEKIFEEFVTNDYSKNTLDFLITSNKTITLFSSTIKYIYRGKNFFQFWKYWRQKLINKEEYIEITEKTDQLFKTVQSLKQICLYNVRKEIWEQTNNSLKYYKVMQSLNISPFMKEKLNLFIVQE